jgi:hypothetical protein
MGADRKARGFPHSEGADPRGPLKSSLVLTAGVFLLKPKWRGKKCEDENERRNEGENLSFPSERFYRLNDHGMAKAKEKQDHCPGYPTIPKVSKRQKDQEKPSRDIPAFIAQDRIKDMAAIELSHREQV